MADINVTQGSMAAVQVRTPQSVTSDIMADADSKTSQGKEKVSVQTEQELENLVSVSPDGDTVQVSREGSARLQENQPDREAVKEPEKVDEEENVQLEVTSGVSPGEKNVIMVSLERKPETDRTEDKEPYVPEINSYAGYSDTQLEQMYLKGEISKFDYDQEMDSREEERKAQQEKEMDFTVGMTEQVQKEEQVEQNAVSIQKAFSSEASNTIAPADRVNIIATLQNLGAV